MCSKEFKYTISIYSPDLLKDMVWLEHDINGLKTLFEELPEHLQRKGKLLRHLSFPFIESTEDNIKVSTSFCLYNTELDGKSSILCVGHYNDEISVSENYYLLEERIVYLDTRDIGVGLHVPI
tara:strand:- start:84 stop:452 length:369 start_codon:yes stop_codon:yes gene_type:complete